MNYTIYYADEYIDDGRLYFETLAGLERQVNEKVSPHAYDIVYHIFINNVRRDLVNPTIQDLLDHYPVYADIHIKPRYEE